MLAGRMIELAGVRVRRELVLGLAEDLLRAGVEGTARLLLNALQMGKPRVSLTVAQRDEILDELDAAPEGLAELRSVLVQEHLARRQQRPS